MRLLDTGVWIYLFLVAMTLGICLWGLKGVPPPGLQQEQYQRERQAARRRSRSSPAADERAGRLARKYLRCAPSPLPTPEPQA